jgi:hypothetical protein
VSRPIDASYLLRPAPIKKEDQNAGYALSSSSTALVTDETGQGALSLGLSITNGTQDSKTGPLCDKVQIAVQGARVASLTADPASSVRVTPSHYELTRPARIELLLGNLGSGHPVKITSSCQAGPGKGADAAVLEIPVVVNPRSLRLGSNGS